LQDIKTECGELGFDNEMSCLIVTISKASGNDKKTVNGELLLKILPMQDMTISFPGKV